MRISHCLIAAAALLAGCSTTQERAAAAQADVERMMQIYGPACTRLGYAVESDQWRNCVLHLSEANDIQRYGYPSYYADGPHYWGRGRGGPYW